MNKAIIFIILCCIFACNSSSEDAGFYQEETNIPEIKYSVVNTLPHSTTSFTEGLLFHNSTLYESTGSPESLPETKSLFGIVDSISGEILVKSNLNRNHYFGEGLTILNDKIFQLTYKKQKCFVYDLKTSKKIDEFNYPNQEGWGLTNNGTHLIMSDGTNFLTFIDTSNYIIKRKLAVSLNGFAVDKINELEYINGYIYANIWPGDHIYKINPNNGVVVGMIDLTQLKAEALKLNLESLETNGIAYDSISDKIVVTGKMWPKLYEIKLQE